MSLEELVAGLAGREGAELQIRRLASREPATRSLPDDLPQGLSDRLRLRGVQGLYEHQMAGLSLLRSGRNVVLATGTASGKSLVYQLAAAESVVSTPKATALLLFPTKALARDQLRALRALTIPQIKAAVYDGDTPKAERPLIRRNANVVLTNPDMLHLAMTGDHTRWDDFLLRLALVVVDEAHVLRGVFGSHVALVLRRLRRLIARGGGDPRWCIATATVGNPGELAERLTGLAFEVIDEDSSPRGRKVVALWNPPVVDEETGARRSALTDASTLMAALVDEEVRTIGFTRSRRAAELLATFARRAVDSAARRDRIKSYRAGYLAEDRRRLERELADGELLGVASTNALELGIDIGSLDAAILTGYPGTRASMWQQVGRAGRRSAESLAVLVAQDDPLDQYLVTHPEELFDRPAEAAVIDPTNPYVLGPHLRCAVHEAPIDPGEAESFFGADAVPVIDALEDEGAFRRRGDRLHHTGGDPHAEVDVRAGSGVTYRIVRADSGEVIGTSDERRAFGTLHPGAVYLHQGEQFVVVELDLVRHVALVEEADPDFTTQARDITDIRIAGARTTRQAGDAELWFGEVDVTNQVVGFVRRLVSTGEIVDEQPLPMPPVTLRTTATWWTLPQRVIDAARVGHRDLPGGIHAAEHAAIGLLPLIATCDRWDVGGVSTPLHEDTGLTTVFVYDGYPGGAGISERGFGAARHWFGATRERLDECPCPAGCPSCVQSPKCGNGNEPLDKAAAGRLLTAILAGTWAEPRPADLP